MSREGKRDFIIYLLAGLLTGVLCSLCSAYEPGTDITAELQAACDNYAEAKQPIVLPPGLFYISDTIMLPTVSGLTFLGSGKQYPYALAMRDRGTGTILKWTGPKGKPMIDYSAAQAEIGNMSLLGDGQGTGILFNKRIKGLGTGKVRIRPMYIAGFDKGIQVGRTKTESNSDKLLFEYVTFHNCKIGYYGLNNQGVDIVFDYVHSYLNVPTFMEFDGGGVVLVKAGLITARNSKFLTINNTRGRGVGKNNGIFRLNNIQIDAQAGLTHQLIDCREPDGILLIIDGVNRAQHGWDFPTAPLAAVCGKNLLTIRNARGNHEIIGTKGRDSIPNVSISDSQFWGLRHSGADVRITNCQAVTGEWLDGESIKRGDEVEIK